MIAKAKVYDYLGEVIDPEMGINIIELGLVYRVAVEEDSVEVDFTLTYPGCPLGPEIEKDIIEVLRKKAGVTDVKTTVVWQPAWQPSYMSEEARIGLGYPI